MQNNKRFDIGNYTRMVKQILFSLLFANFFTSCVSHRYYGINTFGSLEILDDNRFYLDFFDVGNDTGKYFILGDTIFLSSSVQQVKYLPEKSSLMDTTILVDVNMKVYDKEGISIKNGKVTFHNGTLIKDTTLKMDKFNKVYVNNLPLKAGQLIIFDFYGQYKYLVPQDAIYNGQFELNIIFGQRVYFKNYPLLMQDNYLLPFDEESNKYFRKVNGFEFLPMKKGRKNLHYKTYLSGFGEIH